MVNNSLNFPTVGGLTLLPPCQPGTTETVRVSPHLRTVIIKADSPLDPDMS